MGGDDKVLKRGVVVYQGVNEVRDLDGEKIGDENSKSEAERVGGKSLPLVEAIGLIIRGKAIAKLDEGGRGGAVIGEKVEEENMIERVTIGEPATEENAVDELAGSGGVGVLDVEGGVGDGGRAQIDVQLVAARSDFETGRDEAILQEREIE